MLLLPINMASKAIINRLSAYRESISAASAGAVWLWLKVNSQPIGEHHAQTDQSQKQSRRRARYVGY
jgi:hypothetical protein